LRKQIQGISSGAMDLIIKHDWPGNVRELENTMERLVVLSNGPMLEPSDLAYAGLFIDPLAESQPVALKDLEREHILRILQKFARNKSEAARALGIDRKTLREKLKRYSIEA
jgi:two-component system response regulator HydG